MKSICQTPDSWTNLMLRMTLGVVMFPHGAQKMLGWFGGQGFAATIDIFTKQMGMPAAVAFLVIVSEFFGSLGLIVGFLTRIAAFGIMCLMLGAIALVHWQHGFFMNWFGKQQGEGFEYHLLAVAIAAAVIIRGGGKWSIDRAITAKMERP